MNIEVKGCVDCPLREFNSITKLWFCGHPTVRFNFDTILKLDYINNGTPDFCPLKKEPITITLKEDNPQ